MSQEDIDAAVADYQDAVGRIQKWTLLEIAQTVLAKYPQVTHLVVEDSDQGDWLAPAWFESDDGDGPEFDSEDEDNLNAWCSNLFSGAAWAHQWMPFDDSHTSRTRLNLRRIIDTDGDWKKAAN